MTRSRVASAAAPVRPVADVERRARLAERHRLAAGAGATSPAAVARSVVALHSSDPVSVFLSIRARAPQVTPAAIEAALYEERELVRMIGMRRTLHVVPRDLVAAVESGAAAAIARRERARVVGLLEAAGVAGDGGAWLRVLEASALEHLARRGEAFAAELGADDPRLRQPLTLAAGTRYEATISVGPRVVLLLGMEGRIIRGRPRGSWISSQYRWATAERWLGAPIEPVPVADAQAEIVRRWLERFGPGTLDDLRWWTGWTAADVRRALAAVGARPVALDGGATLGYLLAGDLEPVAAPEPAPALLPALDPTTMGWAGRDWYLGPHRARLFDTNGNAGPTIWWDGRVVGGWAQRRSGEIAVALLEDVGREAAAAISAEAARLEAWLGGVRFVPRFRTPLERELVA